MSNNVDKGDFMSIIDAELFKEIKKDFHRFIFIIIVLGNMILPPYLLIRFSKNNLPVRDPLIITLAFAILVYGCIFAIFFIISNFFREEEAITKLLESSGFKYKKEDDSYVADFFAPSSIIASFFAALFFFILIKQTPYVDSFSYTLDLFFYYLPLYLLFILVISIFIGFLIILFNPHEK